MAYIVDSYSESNQSGYLAVAGYWKGGSQSFEGDGGVLNSIDYFLIKNNSPTGSAYAKIYAHTGTFGTDGKPTGSALATSDAFDVSTLTTSYQLITFTFTGANRITLENDTYYCATVEYASGNSTNYVKVGIDETSPSHNGNSASLAGGVWYSKTYDICFYVYADDTEPIVGPFPTFKRQ